MAVDQSSIFLIPTPASLFGWSNSTDNADSSVDTDVDLSMDTDSVTCAFALLEYARSARPVLQDDVQYWLELFNSTDDRETSIAPTKDCAHLLANDVSSDGFLQCQTSPHFTASVSQKPGNSLCDSHWGNNNSLLVARSRLSLAMSPPFQKTYNYDNDELLAQEHNCSPWRTAAEAVRLDHCYCVSTGYGITTDYARSGLSHRTMMSSVARYGTDLSAQRDRSTVVRDMTGTCVRGRGMRGRRGRGGSSGCVQSIDYKPSDRYVGLREDSSRVNHLHTAETSSVRTRGTSRSLRRRGSAITRGSANPAHQSRLTVRGRHRIPGPHLQSFTFPQRTTYKKRGGVRKQSQHKTNSKSTLHKCDLCSKSFTRQHYLISHLRRMHIPADEEQPAVSSTSHRYASERNKTSDKQTNKAAWSFTVMAEIDDSDEYSEDNNSDDDDDNDGVGNQYREIGEGDDDFFECPEPLEDNIELRNSRDYSVEEERHALGDVTSVEELMGDGESFQNTINTGSNLLHNSEMVAGSIGDLALINEACHNRTWPLECESSISEGSAYSLSTVLDAPKDTSTIITSVLYDAHR